MGNGILFLRRLYELYFRSVYFLSKRFITAVAVCAYIAAMSLKIGKMSINDFSDE